MVLGIIKVFVDYEFLLLRIWLEMQVNGKF